MTKIYIFDKSVYIDRLYILSQQIDYEYETYGKTERYIELCSLAEKTEKILRLIDPKYPYC